VREHPRHDSALPKVQLAALLVQPLDQGQAAVRRHDAQTMEMPQRVDNGVQRQGGLPSRRYGRDGAGQVLDL
jgi:hypothetical protein